MFIEIRIEFLERREKRSLSFRPVGRNYDFSEKEERS